MRPKYSLNTPTSRALRLGAVLGLGLAAAGCYPEVPTAIEDIDVVVTAFDESFDFGANLTFAMPDSVVEIDLSGTDTGSYDHSLDALILARIEENLLARGYTRELNPEANGADVVILAQVSTALNAEAYSYYPYDPFWGWYPGWGYWDPCIGCGYYYPWTPSLGTVVTYRTGSVLVEMIDPDATFETPDGPAFVARWATILNGYAEGNNIAARVGEGIDQAFAQSPYLGR